MAKAKRNKTAVKPKGTPVRMTYNRWMAMRYAMNTVRTQDSRALLATELSRDIDMNYECRWPTEITAKNYKDLFERFGTANRVVTVWPSECWILPPEIYETEDQDNETQFEKDWEAMDKSHQVISKLYLLDVLSRIGRYGVMLLGLSDLAENENFTKPVEGAEEIILANQRGEKWAPLSHELLYVSVFQENDASVVEWETHRSHPRYGKPTMYQLNMENPMGGTSNERVHWTRVLHVVDNRLSSEVYGEPAMKPVWNDLIDLRKLKGGASEGYWRACLSGIAWGLNDKLVDPNTTMTEAQEESFLDEVEKYSNSLQRDIISMGLVPHDIAPKLIDPSPFYKGLIELICIQMGVPVAIFMGREEGKLAADENRSAWLERVKGRQSNHVTPRIIRPFVQICQMYGVLPVTAEDVIIKWPDRNSPSDKDIADTALKVTQALSAYVGGGVNQVMGEEQYFGQVFKKDQAQIQAIADEVEDWEELNNPPEPEPEPLPAQQTPTAKPKVQR